MTVLPPGLEPDDEIEVDWESRGDRTMVTASLAGATIIVETDADSAPIVPWLVAGLPQILEAAWRAVEEST